LENLDVSKSTQEKGRKERIVFLKTTPTPFSPSPV
jgi:hypothetical protein